MSTVLLRWIGDLEQDKRDQGGISSSSDKFRPRTIELKPRQKEIKIGRHNTKHPPDYPIESCINARMISRNHATIERLSRGGSMLYDHSMNGTYVNYTRVTGGVALKDGDIVCFGHLNGANLKPGDQVATFHSDLKYRVEICDSTPDKNTVTSTTGNKRKSNAIQPSFAVSSTQHSDDNDGASDDSRDSKRARLSSGGSAASKKALRRPPGFKKKFVEDVEEDKSSDPTDLSSSRRATQPTKSTKKRTTPEKSKKSLLVTASIGRKQPATAGKSSHGHIKDKRGKVGGRVSKSEGRLDDEDEDDEADVSADAAEMFHYDSEECSARPCKQPQDVAIDWIQCDRCALWYHQVCLNLKPSEANVDTYYCPSCKK